MSHTYDPTTDTGRIRLLIGDTDLTAPLFSDEELDAFLDLEGSVYLAAALALDTIANDEALTLKAVTVLDLTTNGPAVATALREGAYRLRELDGNTIYFDFAQMALTPEQVREIWLDANWPLS